MLCWFCRVEASHVSDDTTLLRQETEDRVNDSLILRWFCRVYFEQVPDDTTLIRWAQLIRQQTLHALNDRVVELVTQAKVIKGVLSEFRARLCLEDRLQGMLRTTTYQRRSAS